MRVHGMHAAVAEQAHQVQAARARMLHRGQQRGIAEELARRDHVIDARHVHVDDAARADVQMADFAVAHLALPASPRMARRCEPACWDTRAAGDRSWACARRRWRCLRRQRRVAPAVENRQNQRAPAIHASLESRSLPERLAARDSVAADAEFLFDAQKLVVFRDAIRAARASRS